MQVGTYPTRNFATLGTFVTTQSRRSTSRHSPRAARSFLPSSSCRHEGRTVSSSLIHQPSWDWILRFVREPHVQSLRILQCSFLLIVRTRRIFTTHAATLKNGCDVDEYRWILGCPSIQWGFVTARYKTNRYSYGRRLPGLRFRASPEG